jgi:hypothetical protein
MAEAVRPTSHHSPPAAIEPGLRRPGQPHNCALCTNTEGTAAKIYWPDCHRFHRLARL